MNRYPGWNRADRHGLVLTPRDYAIDPYRFGDDPDVAFQVPPNGTVQSARAALLQHQLIVAWRDTGPSGAKLARRYGLSRATWSRTATGHRWAGQLLITALVEATRAGSSRPPDQRR